MNEFSLINHFFKQQAIEREDVVFGIGDDAACLAIPAGMHLLVSTDTLVADVHFLSEWDAYDIAYKAVMVNISDIAAMAANPCWISLALTLPELNPMWLKRFSEGLHSCLKKFNISLIGGDTTRGPLSITITIHGLAPVGQVVRRAGANIGDKIYVSGELGAAALAVASCKINKIEPVDKQLILDKLKHPNPRIDLTTILRQYASAAIDISDGLSADLNHLCDASGVGAKLDISAIPIHQLVKKYQPIKALDFALSGGDDYELCFTVPTKKEKEFLVAINKLGLSCYVIGTIVGERGLSILEENGEISTLTPKGYSHF